MNEAQKRDRRIREVLGQGRPTILAGLLAPARKYLSRKLYTRKRKHRNEEKS